MPTPFNAALDYLDSGWPGVIPMTDALEGHAKGVPLAGTTGHQGVNLTREQVEEFLADVDLAARWPNISLRADGWVGIDVDHYGEKAGADVLGFLEADLGKLPPTFISSARELPSGIRIFRLPPGVVLEKLAEINLKRFAKDFGYAEPHIDVIRRGHRYVKAWPTPHPNGELYRWYTPSGAPFEGVPDLDWCPELPARWLAFLTELGQNMDGMSGHGVHSDRAALAARPGGSGDRVFSQDEALAFIAPALDELRESRFNSGSFNATLNSVAFQLGHFQEFWGRESVIDLLADAIQEGNGQQVDAADMATIRSGLDAAWDDWQGRLPDERETLNPFAADGRYFEGVRRVAEPAPAAPPSQLVREGSLATDHEFKAILAADAAVNPFAPGYGTAIPQQRVESGAQGESVTIQITSAGGSRKLKAIRASDIFAESSDWLWKHGAGRTAEHWIPLGGLVLLGGREGVGKSTWTARLIAQVTNGKMEGEFLGKPRGVIVSATEDAWAQTIIPRLMAAGADLKRVLRVDAEENETTAGLVLPTDVNALMQLIDEEEVALVVLDPLLGAIAGNLDTHKDSDVRKALEPISRLAAECQVTVLGLIHQNKSQAGDLLTRLMGSRAFSAVARAVLVCAEADPEIEAPVDVLEGSPAGPRQFKFGQIKNNLAARVETSVRYEIESAMVGHAHSKPGREIWSSKIRVVNYRDTQSIEDTVNEREAGAAGKKSRKGKGVLDDVEAQIPISDRPDASKIEQCIDQISLIMSQHPEGIRSTDIEKVLREEMGFSFGTVARAKAQLGIASTQAPGGSKAGGWVWKFVGAKK